MDSDSKHGDRQHLWEKWSGNPVLGGELGTCFDLTLLKENGIYRMWFSWRPQKSIALTESLDGRHWGPPIIVLAPNPATGWEDNINRPSVLRREDGYHLWYTGRSEGCSRIGYATSRDGVIWERRSEKPVLVPELSWEKAAVMCPHVLWDEEMGKYRMWYSAGDKNREPDAIGYAESSDGLVWHKHTDNPIFRPAPEHPWEQHKVTACQVIKLEDYYVMFYIGFNHERCCHIGMARSFDGITNWERYKGNPIISPTEGAWDSEACYKPFALYDEDSDSWLLWYNGRTGHLEQIGLVVHKGYDLGF
ncbi:MAG TPA: hypothetical protein GXX29_12690 [Firmicutes bacterium]|nr:hypothetical protein [Bacillota bacterium]